MTTHYLVIGSAGARYAFGEEWAREPKDWDAFTDSPLTGEDCFWDDRMASWLDARDKTNKSMYATRNELYTIKLSHTAYDLRNNSWVKHMEDLAWMQAKGCTVDEDLYTLLSSIWKDRYGDRKFMLKDDKSEFFADAVTRKYDHDSLHRSVALIQRPMYEFFLKPGATVDMDMSKVWAADKKFQLDLFWEEIAVTALERKVIPSDYTCSPTAAWAWALRRTVTGLTKGRSSRFIRENYSWYRRTKYDYVQQHKNNAHLLEEL